MSHKIYTSAHGKNFEFIVGLISEYSSNPSNNVSRSYSPPGISNDLAKFTFEGIPLEIRRTEDRAEVHVRGDADKIACIEPILKSITGPFKSDIGAMQRRMY